jgi:hypothetical protein
MHFDDIAALQFLNYSDKIYVLKHTRLTTHLNDKMRKLIPHCRNNKKKPNKQTNKKTHKLVGLELGECVRMSIHGMLFQRVSSIQIQLSVLD